MLLLLALRARSSISTFCDAVQIVEGSREAGTARGEALLMSQYAAFRFYIYMNISISFYTILPYYSYRYSICVMMMMMI